MSAETDLIRSASSKWLRDMEIYAIARLRYREEGETAEAALKRLTGWSDAQCNNMATYLSMVDES